MYVCIRLSHFAYNIQILNAHKQIIFAQQYIQKDKRTYNNLDMNNAYVLTPMINHIIEHKKKKTTVEAINQTLLSHRKLFS